MNPTRLRRRQPRLKLNPEEYLLVRNEVLKRDGWRCQECGQMKDLQVHNIMSRSQLGEDVAQNLITLCANCHRKRHGRQKLLDQIRSSIFVKWVGAKRWNRSKGRGKMRKHSRVQPGCKRQPLPKEGYKGEVEDSRTKKPER